ncbi:MAG: ABC transporter permease [Candidatus Limnocylindrales bacterium]
MSSFVAVREISGVTLRQLLGRRRTILLVLLSLVPVLLATAFRASGEVDILRFTRIVFDGLYVAILLPLVAVLFGTGAFGAEIEDGTIIYLLAKPIPRAAVVLAKAASAATVAILLTVVSAGLSGVIELLPAGSDGEAATFAYIAAMALGSICYVALFLALSLFTRRALVIGIGYMLIWEGGLSSLLPGIANLSIRQYALGVADAFFQLHNDPARLSPGTAVTLAAILVVVALVVASWRLMRFELPGSSD